MVLGIYYRSIFFFCCKKRKGQNNSHRIDCRYDAFDENLLRPWLGLFDIIHHLEWRIRFFDDGSFHISFLLSNNILPVLIHTFELDLKRVIIR